MPVERSSGGTSLIDALDRVLEKGVVIGSGPVGPATNVDLRAMACCLVLVDPKGPMADEASLKGRLAALLAGYGHGAVGQRRVPSSSP